MAVTDFGTTDMSLELKMKVSDQMENATIDNTRTSHDFGHKVMNHELEKKVGGQMGTLVSSF